MANRIPLIVDSSTQQIKELPASDNLNLTSSSIVGVASITATSFYGDGSNLTGVSAGSAGISTGKTIALSMLCGR